MEAAKTRTGQFFLRGKREEIRCAREKYTREFEVRRREAENFIAHADDFIRDIDRALGEVAA
jgi:hypothetical protein